jgi:uncharacterized protein YidB (DUF937 family)
MGLLDDAVGALGGGKGGSSGAMGALGGLVEQAGGVQGILTKLQESGLGDKVDSWVGTGGNKAISAQEVEQALGPDQVRQAAEKAGVSEQEAAEGIAGALPDLVNRVSPDGTLPDMGQLDDLLTGFLKK